MCSATLLLTHRHDVTLYEVFTHHWSHHHSFRVHSPTVSFLSLRQEAILNTEARLWIKCRSKVELQNTAVTLAAAMSGNLVDVGMRVINKIS